MASGGPDFGRGKKDQAKLEAKEKRRTKGIKSRRSMLVTRVGVTQPVEPTLYYLMDIKLMDIGQCKRKERRMRA